jgi:hypothetical protein
MARLTLIIIVLLLRSGAVAQPQPETSAGFSRYVEAAEKRMRASLDHEKPFLWLDSLLPPEKQKVLQQLGAGVVVTDRLHDKVNGSEIPIPKGMVHHWIGTVFVPTAKIDDAFALLQDYDNHKNLYKPEVIGSRLLSHDGDDFRAYLRFHKEKIVGVTLDTEHEAHYERLSAVRAFSSSHTTKVAEVENAGEKNEHPKPPGQDNGFLWALNTYWRFEQRDGSLYIQCEAITLTRSIPMLLAPIVKPFVTDVPKESLNASLNSTRVGLLHRLAASK